MKKLLKDEMKKVRGGDPPYNWCAAYCGSAPGNVWHCFDYNIPPNDADICSVDPPSAQYWTACVVRQYCN